MTPHPPRGTRAAAALPPGPCARVESSRTRTCDLASGAAGNAVLMQEKATRETRAPELAVLAQLGGGEPAIGRRRILGRFVQVCISTLYGKSVKRVRRLRDREWPCRAVYNHPAEQRTTFGRRGRSGGSTSRQEDLAAIIAYRQRQITTAGLVSGCGGSAYHPVTQVQPARAQSCLTRAAYGPVVWPHEIPDAGISHRNAGSGPRSGTEAGDFSPVFAALEHAAGDFTTLGKNPPLEGSSPPSDTVFPQVIGLEEGLSGLPDTGLTLEDITPPPRPGRRTSPRPPAGCPAGRGRRS